MTFDATTGARVVRRPPAKAGEWSVHLYRSDGGLTELAEEWDALHAGCSTATPFQSHAWLESWWRAYGVPGRLRLVLVRRDGKLAAAAALVLQQRWGCDVLVPVGQGVSDFTDILVDDAYRHEAPALLGRALLRTSGWHAIDFWEVRPGSAVRSLFDQWGAPRWRTPASVCLELPGAPMDTLVAQLPRHAASRIRAKLRKIDRAGITVEAVAPGEAGEAAAMMLRLHRDQWAGRGVEAEHARPRFGCFLQTAIPGLVAGGHADLFQYRAGDRVLASDLVLIGRDFVGGYLYGVHPDLRSLDVSALLLRENLRMTHQLGRPVFSMLRGAEEHKMRWRPQTVRNQRLVFGRAGGLRAATYAGFVRARARAATFVKEEPWAYDVWQRGLRLRERIGWGTAST